MCLFVEPAEKRGENPFVGHGIYMRVFTCLFKTPIAQHCTYVNAHVWTFTWTCLCVCMSGGRRALGSRELGSFGKGHEAQWLGMVAYFIYKLTGADCAAGKIKL